MGIRKVRKIDFLLHLSFKGADVQRLSQTINFSLKGNVANHFSFPSTETKKTPHLESSRPVEKANAFLDAEIFRFKLYTAPLIKKQFHGTRERNFE